MTKGVFIMKACGKVHKYGDNVDTDVIIPARYLNTPDMQELHSTAWRILTLTLQRTFRRAI